MTDSAPMVFADYHRAGLGWWTCELLADAGGRVHRTQVGPAGTVAAIMAAVQECVDALAAVYGPTVTVHTLDGDPAGMAAAALAAGVFEGAAS